MGDRLFGGGEGGLEELKDEFEEGKIQYAFARVTEPVSNLPKFVFIGWCGDGVPIVKKSLFNYHVSDVQRFFKGFHVAINARTIDDVDPAVILKKVKDSAGAKYSMQEARTPSVTIPPSSKGQQPPTKPVASNSFSRPAFNAPAIPPAIPPVNRVHEEQQLQRDQQLIKDREVRQLEAERLKQLEVEQERMSQLKLQEDTRIKQQQEQQRRNAERLEMERLELEQKEHLERQQREAEARLQQTEAKASQGLTAIVLYDYTPEESNEIALTEHELIVSIVQVDEGWWQGTNAKGESGLFPANYVEIQQSSISAEVPPSPHQQQPREPANQSATALYDYDAAEPNEISFTTGEVISDIVFVSEDWWQGTIHGISGLFPGNYVELIQM